MKTLARNLRKNQTEAEKIIWYQLRNRNLSGYKFRRQYTIGRYIVDFVCLDRKLVVELDGSQHFETKIYDDKRSEFLNQNGFMVLRFWNNEVFDNLDGVLERISLKLEARHSTLVSGRQGAT